MPLYSPLDFVCWGSHPRYDTFSDRGFDTWGLQYTHAGTLTFALGDEPMQNYTAPCLFLSRPGVRFRYGSTAEGRSHHFVTFSGERVADYRAAGLLGDEFSRPAPVAAPEEFLLTFQRLLRLLSIDRQTPEAVNLLERLLFLQREESATRPREGELYREEFDRLERRIRQQPLVRWDFPAEAKKSGISYSHFRRLFQQFLQVPPGRFVRNCRFNLAAEMLLGGNLRIQEIAQRCGFEDFYFFSKQFKQHYGVPPTEFRLRYRGDVITRRSASSAPSAPPELR